MNHGPIGRMVATGRKSTYSAANDNCVEVAKLQGGGRTVRDSKNPSGPMLRFTSTEWQEFIHGMKSGELR
ncbi:DUF397 domain-containing protein [Sphaerisporangium sp. NPDC088356]|uniref:DUF397 domain-containing protein n=1 Tax=Sphaerisporangium sp. NPDC088356 TaxID=3154871 RepID=UPI00342D10F5